MRAFRGRWPLPLITAIVVALLVPAVSEAATAPRGVSAIALSARVELGWQPSAGATAYAVYRGTSPTTITTRVSPPGGALGTAFSDTTAQNGTTYFYVVRAIEAGIESANSLRVAAAPAAASCTAGNPVVRENCLPGNPNWNVRNVAAIATGGIEGYATAQSIDNGESVDLKVRTSGTAFDVEVYRVGYYGGAGARLVSVMRDIPATAQPTCVSNASTGLVDCGNWSTSATLSTTAAWPSGMYLLRLVRTDNGSDYHVLLAVRDDQRAPDVVYGSAFSTFQAYNNYGGKSLYTWNSNGANTVSGQTRAVKVSFDRPYEQPRIRQHDWFTDIEQPEVEWLEKQGYDIGYISDTDLEHRPELARSGEAYFSTSHDEYYSTGMRSALEQARDAGDGLFFSGANAVYWRVRFENGALSGGQDRVLVCYKTTESGPADPSGIHTTTWRDPSGANQPENALIGIMYVGQAVGNDYRLRVPAEMGNDRLFRYTGLDDQPAGGNAILGQDTVGWEWDARVANGAEPAGVKTLSASPVTGSILQDAGRVYSQGNTLSNMAKYKAASGALVFASGTNQWWRGLATNAYGEGQPLIANEQITVNALADMGAKPATPSAGIQLDTPVETVPPPTSVSAFALGTDTVSVSWAPTPGASGYTIYRSRTPRDDGFPLGARVNSTAVTSTTYSDSSLVGGSTYYYVVTATVDGVQSAPSAEVAVTTPMNGPSTVRINAGGGQHTLSTGASFASDRNFTGGSMYSTPLPVSGTTESALYQDERYGAFSYAIPVPNGTYDVRLHFAELYWGVAGPPGAGKRVFDVDVLDTTPNPDIDNLDIFAEVGARTALVKTIAGVTVADGALNLRTIMAIDNPEIAAIELLPATPQGPPTVTSTTPASGATDVVTSIHPTATFSRPMDASTINGSTVTLRGPGGAAVPASVSYSASSQTATITPNSALAASTTYTAQVGTGVRGEDGSALPSAVTWTLTTQAPPAPPTVTQITPANGATGIAAGVRPTATFSRDMDPATLTSSNVVLEPAAGGTVAAAVSYDAGSRVVTLTPSSALAGSTQYRVRLTTGVRSADGVALATAVQSTFTTGEPPPPDTQAPTVSVTAPLAGATVQGSVAVSANASDNVGVAGVQFKLDGADLGAEDTGAPYGVTLDSATVANGSHTLTAVARDAAGNQQTSAPVGFTIDNPVADPSGLVAAFGFEETSGTAAADASSAGNDGTIDGATRTDSGRHGRSLSFDGSNDMVTVADAGSLDLTGAMTLEAWVNPTSVSGWDTVILKERTSNAMSWGLYSNGAGHVPSGHVSTGGSEVEARGSTALAANTWTHLATTYDGATVRLYVNGSQVASRARTGDLDPSALPLRIGGNAIWGEWFAGRIDDVRIYNRALTAAQITTDMGLGVSVGPPDTQPPSAPGSLTATVQDDTDVALDWAAATDDRGVTEYRVHRGSATGFTPTAGNRIATVTSGTSYTDDNLAPGTYRYVVVAVDGASNASGPSPERAATISPDTTAPQVALNAPTDGATVSGTVNVTATASDNRGVKHVEFKLDGDALGAADTSSPYAVSWDTRTAPNGQHTLTAVAEDTAGNRTTSGAVQVTVDNTAPSNGCPCRLFSAASAPAWTGLDTANGRSGGGPYSLEMGLKLRVTSAAKLEAISFYKSPDESGTHTGRLWSASGQLLGSVTFTGETGSGWQTQPLATPIDLTANQVYVVSVGMNQRFTMTGSGLATELVSGVLRSVDDGQNGVYADAAGTFPTNSWSESNYWVDAVVR